MTDRDERMCVRACARACVYVCVCVRSYCVLCVFVCACAYVSLRMQYSCDHNKLCTLCTIFVRLYFHDNNRQIYKIATMYRVRLRKLSNIIVKPHYWLPIQYTHLENK